MRYCLFLLAMFGAAAPAWAENRAVVIGNADYRHAPDLAGSDTAALAEVIRKAGFVTREGVDLPSDQMRRVLDLLAMADPAPGTRIVMLSGRFLTSGDETWFMGTEAERSGPLAAGGQGVPLGLVMQMLAGADRGAVLLLGTDRQVMPHEQGLESGLGALVAVKGVSVITGSPEATAKALRELVAGRPVGRALAAGPGLELLPGGDPRLVAASPSRPASPQPDPDDIERSAWAEATRLDTVKAYATYLERNPAGAFATAARERRAGLLLLEQARATASGSPAQTESALALPRDLRIQVQRGLSRLGRDPGAADGIWGQQTRQALQGWQRDNGFDPTGYLTAAQLAELQNQIRVRDSENAGVGRQPQRPGFDRMQRLWSYLSRYPKGLIEAGSRPQAAPPEVATAQTAASRDALATWRWVRRQDSPAAYQLYLERFPEGQHANDANLRRDNLLAATEVARRHEAALGLTQPMRLELESALQRAGLDPGPVDGEITGQTRQALRHYQAAHNLRVTGYLSRQTAASLRADSSASKQTRTTQ